MPSAELFVRLLLPIVSLLFLSFRLSSFSLKASMRLKPCTYDVHILKYVRPLYPGASCTEAYYYYFPSIKLTTYVPFPRMYLFFAIICIDMT